MSLAKFTGGSLDGTQRFGVRGKRYHVVIRLKPKSIAAAMGGEESTGAVETYVRTKAVRDTRDPEMVDHFEYVLESTEPTELA